MSKLTETALTLWKRNTGLIPLQLQSRRKNISWTWLRERMPALEVEFPSPQADTVTLEVACF